MEVRPAQAQQLSIGVREQPALQQRIVAEIDARDDMADMEGGLLGLGKEVVGVAVEGHLAELLHRHQLFGDDLGRVEQVEVELVLIGLFNHLHAQFPLEVVAHFDGLPHVTAVEVRVLAGQLQRLIPDQREGTGDGLPVEFDEAAGALGIDQAEGVHAEAFHGAQAARDAAVGHGPDDHVRRLRRQRDEIPEAVMRRLTLWDFIVRLGLHRVDKVGKLDGVLNKEHRHVVADQVENAFVGVELGGETAHIAHGISRAARALYGGETREYRRLLALARKKRRLGKGAVVVVADEHAMGSRTTGVHDALGNALVVEVRELLAHDEVFEQRGAAFTGTQSVLVISDFHALVGGQRFTGGVAACALELIELGVVVLAVDGVGTGNFAVFWIFVVRHLGPRLSVCA